MANFQHIATGIQSAALLAALEAKPHLFGQHTARATAYGSPHQAMTDIWVRFNDIANLGPHFTEEHDSVWYPAYAELPELAPVIFGLMAHVHGERLGGVLITKIPPGGRIEPHIDQCWHADYYDKFYIPLRNDPGALFHFPEGDIVATPGDCYWFDNGVMHSVSNDSQAERISLIVCIKTDNFKELKRDRI